MQKKKFVQIIMGIGGSGSQMSPRQHYRINPMQLMESKGYIPEIWTLRKKKEPKEELLKEGKIRRFSNTLSLLTHLLFEKDIALLVAHLRPYLPSLLSPLALKNSILVPHTYELGSNWPIKKLSLLFMKRFSKIIALTPHERDIYLRNGIRQEKVVLLPHAIDYTFFSTKPNKDADSIKKQYAIKEGEFVITTVGNFRKIKNVDNIISAFATFHNKIPKSKLLIVGINQFSNPKYKEQSASKYNEVKNPEDTIKKHKLENQVTLTGGLDYRKVREILWISDVFVNSSSLEAMCLSVYEAAAANLPLCLPNIGPFTSVFEKKALYHDPRDAATLAENFIIYYESKALQEKNGEAVQSLVKGWDYDVFIKKLDNVFSEVISA